MSKALNGPITADRFLTVKSISGSDSLRTINAKRKDTSFQILGADVEFLGVEKSIMHINCFTECLVLMPTKDQMGVIAISVTKEGETLSFFLLVTHTRIELKNPFSPPDGVECEITANGRILIKVNGRTFSDTPPETETDEEASLDYVPDSNLLCRFLSEQATEVELIQCAEKFRRNIHQEMENQTLEEKVAEFKDLLQQEKEERAQEVAGLQTKLDQATKQNTEMLAIIEAFNAADLLPWWRLGKKEKLARAKIYLLALAPPNIEQKAP